jgi:hypothetical protein
MALQSEQIHTPHASSGRRRLDAMVGVAAVVLAVFICAWRLWLNRVPPTDADPAKLAAFISSPRFERLPELARRDYLDALREGKDDIYQAYAKHQISAQQYETALLNIWISRSLKHVDEYSQLRPGLPRQQFLDRLVTKGEKKRQSTTRPSPNTLFDSDPYDNAFVKNLVAGWPSERRALWEELRSALRQRRTERGFPPSSGIWY